METAARDINNARHEAQIETSYALSPYLRQHQINITVSGGHATLTGIVEEGIYKELAEQIAMGVPDIETVDNEITIKEDYTQEPRSEGERSFGEVVDDASITAAVKSKLLWSTYTDGMDTQITTDLGQVTLTGTAENEDKKALAEMLSLNTRGVKSVDNQLVLATNDTPVSDKNHESSSTGHAISDTWITTKVKSTYLMSKNIHSRDISVSTLDGVVTLEGEIHSGAEHELAVELAQNIKGVTSVKAQDLTF